MVIRITVFYSPQVSSKQKLNKMAVNKKHVFFGGQTNNEFDSKT